MKKYLIPFVALCLIVFIGAFVRNTPAEKGVAQTVTFYQQATNTAIGCGNASSTLLLATSTGSRTYVRISNASSKDMYLAFGASAATSSGIYLSGSSTAIFGDNNVVYAGSIYCMAVGATATATVTTIP